MADSTDQWPELVQSLLELLQANSPDDGAQLAPGPLSVLDEQRFLAWLSPHVLRVLALQQREHAHGELQSFFDDVLGRQPVAMALCESGGAVRWASQPMREVLATLAPASLHELILSPAARPGVHTLPSSEGPRTLVLLDVPALGPSYCALLLPGASPTQLDAAQLQAQHGFTPAESAVANLLAQGLSPEDIARTHGTSIDTVRSQLKKIMAKLGVNRQGEAVARLITGAASVNLGRSAHSGGGRPFASFSHQGMRMAYVVHGPADGYPVFFFHSWAGSRHQVPANTAPLFAHGIKLIAMDRPGMGGSTGPSALAPWQLAEPLQALAQHLGYPRYSLLGYSAGSIYATACAAALPRSVERLFLACPVAPLRGLRDLRGTLPSGQLLMALALKAPSIADAMVRLWMAQMRRKPALYLDNVLPHLAPMDREAMSAPAARDDYIASLLEAIRQGDAGILRELRDMASDFTHHQGVQQPTRIWHGLQDSHVPYGHAERLHSEMPHSELVGLDQSGHFLLFYHWPQIVAEIAAQLQWKAADGMTKTHPWSAKTSSARPVPFTR